MTDYARQVEQLASSRFGAFTIDSRANYFTLHGKSLVMVYGAWSKRMGHSGTSAAHRSQVEVDMTFLRDPDERDYVMMLETSVRDHMAVYERPPSIFLTAY